MDDSHLTNIAFQFSEQCETRNVSAWLFFLILIHLWVVPQHQYQQQQCVWTLNTYPKRHEAWKDWGHFFLNSLFIQNSYMAFKKSRISVFASATYPILVLTTDYVLVKSKV